MPRTYFVVGSYYQHEDYFALLAHLRQLGDQFLDFAILSCEQRGGGRKPSGFSATYNRLVEHAFSDSECQYVWLLNDDALPVGDCLLDTQNHMETQPDIGVIFPVEAWEENGRFVTLLPVLGSKVSIDDAFLGTPDFLQVYAGFACACIRREAWEAVGPMDLSLGKGYAEDLDWGLRSWKAGYRVVNYRRAWFRHKRGATFNRLITDGLFDKSEPYQAAKLAQEKWPELELWKKSFDEIMTILRAWQAEATKKETP